MAKLYKYKGRYYARFRDPNRHPPRKKVPLRVTLKSAADKRRKYLEDLWAEGKFDPWSDDPFGHASQNITTTKAIEAFLQDRNHLRPRTLDTYQQQLGAWEKQHVPPGFQLRDISPDHLEPYVWKKTLSTASKRKRYRHLRAFLNWSVEGGYVDQSPLKKVRRPKKEKKQAAFLSREDVDVLLRTIDAHAKITTNAAGQKPDVQWLKDMIAVAVRTGLRRSELCQLHWKDVDLRHRLLTVRSREGAETKSGHERQIPLRGEALDVLHRLQAKKPENNSQDNASDLHRFVFVDDRGLRIKPDRATKRFKFFVRKAKLPDCERLRFHSLRHTFGSWLVMDGAPMKAVQTIMGHSTMSLTSETYAHLNPEVLARAVESAFE